MVKTPMWPRYLRFVLVFFYIQALCRRKTKALVGSSEPSLLADVVITNISSAGPIVCLAQVYYMHVINLNQLHTVKQNTKRIFTFLR